MIFTKSIKHLKAYDRDLVHNHLDKAARVRENEQCHTIANAPLSPPLEQGQQTLNTWLADANVAANMKRPLITPSTSPTKSPMPMEIPPFAKLVRLEEPEPMPRQPGGIPPLFSLSDGWEDA